MDGNGRWAKKRFLPRVEGHRNGAKTVRMVVEESRRLGVRYLTLFTFSSENWDRPKEEVESLMKLFAQYLESELELLCTNGIRLRSIGEKSKLPLDVQEILARNEEATKDNTGMDLILAISYGGREEILNAVKQVALDVQAGTLSVDSLSERDFRNRLYAPDVPDPDLLIRTSAENRISNFLLWQLAYSEIVVTTALWPEFSKTEYHRCLNEFAGRERRFGKTSDQLKVEDSGSASTSYGAPIQGEPV